MYGILAVMSYTTHDVELILYC